MKQGYQQNSNMTLCAVSSCDVDIRQLNSRVFKTLVNCLSGIPYKMVKKLPQLNKSLAKSFGTSLFKKWIKMITNADLFDLALKLLLWIPSQELCVPKALKRLSSNDERLDLIIFAFSFEVNEFLVQIYNLIAYFTTTERIWLVSRKLCLLEI